MNERELQGGERKPRVTESSDQRAGSYWLTLLAAEGRPFQPRSGVFRLLGRPASSGEVAFARPLPPVGFTYARPDFSGGISNISEGPARSEPADSVASLAAESMAPPDEQTRHAAHPDLSDPSDSIGPEPVGQAALRVASVAPLRTEARRDGVFSPSTEAGKEATGANRGESKAAQDAGFDSKRSGEEIPLSPEVPLGVTPEPRIPAGLSIPGLTHRRSVFPVDPQVPLPAGPAVEADPDEPPATPTSKDTLPPRRVETGSADETASPERPRPASKPTHSHTASPYEALSPDEGSAPHGFQPVPQAPAAMPHRVVRAPSNHSGQDTPPEAKRRDETTPGKPRSVPSAVPVRVVSAAPAPVVPRVPHALRSSSILRSTHLRALR